MVTFIKGHNQLLIASAVYSYSYGYVSDHCIVLSESLKQRWRKVVNSGGLISQQRNFYGKIESYGGLLK